MRVDLHPEARSEFRSAALWYEERREGLGAEFVGEVEAVLTRIGEAPQLFPQWVGTEKVSAVIRKASLQRFPYAIAFEEYKHHVVALAVAHQKRRPLYWLKRVHQQPG